MVLTSTCENTSIEELAQLIDRIIEIAVPPSVSNVSTQLSELDQYKVKQRSQASHKEWILYDTAIIQTPDLTAAQAITIHQTQLTDHADRLNSQKFAGITDGLEIRHTNAHLHVSSQETNRPAANGSQGPGLLPSRLFHITDHSNGLYFLINTDAEVRVIPP